MGAATHWGATAQGTAATHGAVATHEIALVRRLSVSWRWMALQYLSISRGVLLSATTLSYPSKSTYQVAQLATSARSNGAV